MKCPHCKKEFNAGSEMGKVKSEKKAEAARRNGRKSHAKASTKTIDAMKTIASLPDPEMDAAGRKKFEEDLNKVMPHFCEHEDGDQICGQPATLQVKLLPGIWFCKTHAERTSAAGGGEIIEIQ